MSVFLFFGKIEIGENTDKKIGIVRTRLRKSTDRKMKTRTKIGEKRGPESDRREKIRTKFREKLGPKFRKLRTTKLRKIRTKN